MPLPAYGLLIGKPTASRPQSGGHPHWLVMVQPALKGHPAYRVAVNLESTDPDAPPEVQYQVIKVAADGSGAKPGLKALVARLAGIGAMDSFHTGDGVPALDFVRGDLLDPAAFQTIPAGANPLKDAFQVSLRTAIQADESDGGLLAVFGTGYPVQSSGKPPSTGFTGIDNIHMNQGAPNHIGAGDHYLENGGNQDGGLIFLAKDGSATAFFVKFQTQTLKTDPDGNPTDTGNPAIDANMATVREVLHTAPAIQAALDAAPTPVGVPATGFVFADPADDAVESYVPDVDTHFQTPFVQTIAAGQQRTPVPSPRPGANVYMDLAGVVGPNIPGHSNEGGSETLVFDMLGDSGAVTAAKQKGELSVGELMIGMAKQSPPAFCFHVGDVVYYYGEKQFYYGQFAEVFKEYPAPIFAIPGNHDALTFDPSQTPLSSFIAAFCAPTPGTWDGFGGVLRSTMTQPGVYFTLDAPLVSIIGLYSNAAESGGWLNDQQYAFLLSELQRLKPLRDARQRAVMLCIHHLPKWFPSAKDPTSAALDAHFTQAGLWPDAVVVGHAHLYQRVVRQAGVRGAPANIPYLVNGGGGYGIVPTQASGGAYVKALPAGLATVIAEEGFLRVTVDKSAASFTLQFDYHSAKRAPGAAPADTYTVRV